MSGPQDVDLMLCNVLQVFIIDQMEMCTGNNLGVYYTVYIYLCLWIHEYWN